MLQTLGEKLFMEEPKDIITMELFSQLDTMTLP